jgi:alkylation response protein AidB-like acyl-CoA dehydrogenase
MDVVVTEDQEFFRSTTQRFLEDKCPLGTVRALVDSPDGFERDYWRQGAELGWTSLLVPEVLGGGTVSGAGILDLACLADVFGAHVAPGPLLATNVVADAVCRAGTSEQQAEVLPGILAGDTVAAWAHEEPTTSALAAPVAVVAARDGDGFVLDGVKTPVEAGAQAALLLVTAVADDGPAQFLVDPHADGVTITRLESVDMTRRYAKVAFDGVRVAASARIGTAAGTRGDIDRQLQLAAVVLSTEAVAAAQVLFDMTVGYAFDRYTFGRPLASYQALKHRFADMKLWLEASHAIAAAAATELQEELPDAAETASAAQAYTGDRLAELAQDCVQIHGGIGLTYEHDLHLFMRRIVANRLTFGTPADHRLAVADIRELLV